ncbi:MAG: DUF3822 family protein [Tannerella sp.]|jgi:hypothetical protein|nr:DUF3822 family protein [Tannerella sp.]
MSYRVSGTLTPDNAEKYITSIRLRPGGLSFAFAEVGGQAPPFYEDIPLDKSKNYVQALTAAFFENAFLAFPYKRSYVMCSNRTYTYVPESVYVDAKKDQLLSLVFSKSEYKTLSERIESLSARIVFGIQPDVHAFILRTLQNPVFVHSATRLISSWREHSATQLQKQLYIAPCEGIVHAACFDRGTALFANSFRYEDTADILYFALYAWKQLGLEQLHDELQIAAEPDLYGKLVADFKLYISSVKHLPLPSPDYPTSLPCDIAALFSCEL